MKKALVYLVLVLLMFGGCTYLDDTIDFEMDPFDEAACYTVDGGLVGTKTLYASADPNFLDDKIIDAMIKNADSMKVITTEIDVKLVTGYPGTVYADSLLETRAFATIVNYYDSVNEVELYLHKTTDVVDSLLAGQTYDGVTLATNLETAKNAYFDSVKTEGAIQNFIISEEMGNYDFFKEATRCLYGKNGSIPVFEFKDKPTRVTCAAVEVMSLYSYLEVETDDIYTFYFNEHMSMRIWDEDGNRIPMSDNGISLEMAAEFGGLASGGSGRVVAKAVYDLAPGTYFVRWIRAESTKSASQFTATNPESETNYFRFRVGIFPSSYEPDPEIVDIAEKIADPTVTKIMKSVAQCDTSLWEEDDVLNVNDLMRSPDKMNALLDNLDSITVADLDQGLRLSYDPSLPQGLFFMKFSGLDSLSMIDTMRIYIDGGQLTMYKRVQDFDAGGKKFNPFTPDVVGLTFKEAFVSTDIKDVYYLYNFDENLYIVSLKYEGESDGVNMVLKGN